MKRIVSLMLAGMVAVCLASSVRAENGTAEEAQAMVTKALEFVKANGKEKSVEAFHDKAGEFFKGDLYIFFYGLDGTVFANGQSPKTVGKNRMDATDADGKKHIAEMIELVKTKGEGWVDYKYSNPESKKIEPKSTFVKKVDGMDAFVACGIYKKD